MHCICSVRTAKNPVCDRTTTRAGGASLHNVSAGHGDTSTGALPPTKVGGTVRELDELASKHEIIFTNLEARGFHTFNQDYLLARYIVLPPLLQPYIASLPQNNLIPPMILVAGGMPL